MKRLLTINADINAVAANYYKWTVLQVTVEQENLKILKRLLTANANVNAAAADYYS